MAAKKKSAPRKSASKKARTRKGVIPVSEVPEVPVAPVKEPNPGEKATTEELRKFRDEELHNTPRKH